LEKLQDRRLIVSCDEWMTWKGDNALAVCSTRKIRVLGYGIVVNGEVVAELIVDRKWGHLDCRPVMEAERM
jgi:hypothetical protein